MPGRAAFPSGVADIPDSALSLTYKETLLAQQACLLYHDGSGRVSDHSAIADKG